MTQAQKTDLGIRVTTGVIGGAVLLGLLVFGGRIGVSLLALLIAVVSSVEFSQMVFGLPDRAAKTAWLVGSVAALHLVSFAWPGDIMMHISPNP